ncbi:MAG: class I SAM-dependent methyltransferase [Candidatus Dormibacteraeota bacterium]|nr:class I SAM-dependent methyltransferase [Candidatus Dormibacteraeota bacterium]
MSAATCRSCGGSDLEVVLSLGRTPLANSLLTQAQLAEPEPTYPLDLAYCRACSLLQITETVPPEQLFREYLYFSSFSDTMLKHSEELAQELTKSRRLTGQSLVVEVASNDGYLLQFYKRAGIPVLGIEPARNVARVAEQNGIPTIVEFFDRELAQELAARGQRADVIHAHNVLAHVADLNGFVEGFETLLKKGGVAVVEAPYVKDLLDRCEFDTIYHEHLCYYSLTALDRLARRHGLEVQDVRRVPIHGGSLRVEFGRIGEGDVSDAVRDLLAEESAWGVDNVEVYRKFAQRVAGVRSDLRQLLQDLKQKGKRLAAYGAAAKGSTLLNYAGIGTETLDFVVDRSTYKQGRYMPGVHLPIHAPARLLEEMPDYVLLLTWNFADEIMSQQAEYRRRNGKFIIPIPQLQVV